MSKEPHLWGEQSLGTSDVPFGDRLVFETSDTHGAEFAAQVQAAAFAGDGTTDHKDIIFSLPLFNLGADGNLINAQRPGVKLVFECEYTPNSAALTVTGATNTTPIRVTVSEPIDGTGAAGVPAMVAGELLYLGNVGGNTAANGYYKAKNLAALRGTTDISAAGLYGGGGTLNGLTLTLNVSGGGATTLTLNGATNAASKAALLAAIAVQWAALVATDAADSVGHNLLLTNAGGTNIIVGAGTANAALGLSAGTYSSRCFEPWNWVLSSADTPSVGNGAYTSGGQAVYRLTMEWYIAVIQPGQPGSSQTRPIGGTFNADGAWSAVTGILGKTVAIGDANTTTLGLSGTAIALGDSNTSSVTVAQSLTMAANKSYMSAGTLDVRATGTNAITIESATGDIHVGTDATAKSIAIGTGAASISTTIGTLTGGTTTMISGSGGMLFKTNFAQFDFTDNANNDGRGVVIARDGDTQWRLVGTGAVTDLKVGFTKLGLYGVGPVVQGAVGATLTNNVTVGGTTNTVDNITAASVDTSAAKLTDTRNAIYQLTLKLATLEAKLKLLGAVQT